MKNAANRLVRQRWDMAVPTSSAFGQVPGPNHTVPQHEIRFETSQNSLPVSELHHQEDMERRSHRVDFQLEYKK